MKIYAIYFILICSAVLFSNGQIITTTSSNSALGIKSCPPVNSNSLGFCPLTVHCDFDNQCSNGQLCCPGSCNQQYCQNPIIRPSTTKSGVCRQIGFEVSSFWCASNWRSTCKSDWDCSGNQKCCKTVCNRSICMDPLILLPTRK